MLPLSTQVTNSLTVKTALEITALAWLALSIVGLITICFLAFYLYKKIRKPSRKSITQTKLNQLNTAASNVNKDLSTRKLYKKLSKTYHPDRFINTEHYEVSVLLFQDISKYRKNHKKLIELEKLAASKI